MSNTLSGFKLTPRKLLVIALIITTLLVIALVGFTYSMLTSKPAPAQSSENARQIPNRSEVEMLTPGGGTSTVVIGGTASQLNKASAEAEHQAHEEAQKRAAEAAAESSLAAETVDRVSNVSNDPRENRPQPVERNITRQEPARETPLEPIRRSAQAEPVRMPEQQIAREAEPVRTEPAPVQQQQPANPPRQPQQSQQQRGEVMDNLF